MFLNQTNNGQMWKKLTLIPALQRFIHRVNVSEALLISYVIYAMLQPCSHKFDWTVPLNVIGKVFELFPPPQVIC